MYPLEYTLLEDVDFAQESFGICCKTLQDNEYIFTLCIKRTFRSNMYFTFNFGKVQIGEEQEEVVQANQGPAFDFFFAGMSQFYT